MENETLKEQNAQPQDFLYSTLSVLENLLKCRDKTIGDQIERKTAFLKILMNAMIIRGIYADEMKKMGMDLDMLCHSARVHDVGKFCIPDAVLFKPNKLTAEEIEIMKTHAIEGERIIDEIISQMKDKGKLLYNAKLFAGYHHERWDGKGYPRGLDRMNIPIQGRIMAVVDVYDALVSERPYKEPFTPEEAVKIIMDSSGEMFDPLIVEVFFEARKQFETVT